jgi:hypothetical protein
MAEKKEALKVKDFTDTVKEITGLVRDSYLNGIELALSLWEENIKILNTQVDHWLDLEKDYINTLKDSYEKFPKEIATFWDESSKTINGEVDRLFALQKEYIESVRSVSEKSRKEALDLIQKNVDRTFALFDNYLNLFVV